VEWRWFTVAVLVQQQHRRRLRDIAPPDDEGAFAEIAMPRRLVAGNARREYRRAAPEARPQARDIARMEAIHVLGGARQIRHRLASHEAAEAIATRMPSRLRARSQPPRRSPQVAGGT